MQHLNSDQTDQVATPRNRAEQSRLNGARSRGPTSEEGKQISSRNAFKTGLWAKTLHSFPPDSQSHYRQLLEAYQEDYRPADSIEADLLSQLAFNRMRYHHFLKIEGQALDAATLDDYPVALFDHLRRTIEGLERSYLRTLKTLEDRRRHNPQLAQPSKIVVEWIDPRTGEPWRPEKPQEDKPEETNPTPEPDPEPDPEPETKETNPALAPEGEPNPAPDPKTEQTNPPTQSSPEPRPCLCRP